MAGSAAVEAAIKGNTGSMVVFNRKSTRPYICTTEIYDIHDIANMERRFPTDWISEDGCNVTNEYLEYARPLIQGEVIPFYENGIPKHLVL